MLHDDDFSSKAKVDRYGRKLVNRSGTKDLEKYYHLDESTSEEDEPDEENEFQRELKKINDGDESIELTSSEESETEDEDSEEEEVFGVIQQEAAAAGSIPVGQVTSRLAVVNLDWDNIRATDLMAVFSSFIPSTGRITKISIYPSDFGRERMDREDMEGPPKDIFPSQKVDSEISDLSEQSESEGVEQEDNDSKIKKSIIEEDKGIEFDSAKLRRYQLERLRYFFAVIDCSSTTVAEAIYNAVDGTEYLTTANFFDLRFISKDTDFESDIPRDECERIPHNYKPNDFVTDALQHSKVKLTWDADDVERKEAQKRAFSGSRDAIKDNDLKAYLASDSSEDEEDIAPSTSNEAGQMIEHDGSKSSKKEAQRQRMRAVLGLDNQSRSGEKENGGERPVGDLQVTFESGFSAEPAKGSVFINEPEKEETTVEKYVRKEKERKAKRKERMKNARNGIPEDVDEPNVGPTETAQIDEARPDASFDDAFFEIEEPTIVKERKKKRKHSPSPEPMLYSAHCNPPIPEDDASDDGLRHFDTNLLAKADKILRKGKKNKKQHISERQKEALEAKDKDNFEIDVQDPRFSAVLNNPEYAIDPSHKGYKDTEAMRALLNEGRRRHNDEMQDSQATTVDPHFQKRKKEKARGKVKAKAKR